MLKTLSFFSIYIERIYLMAFLDENGLKTLIDTIKLKFVQYKNVGDGLKVDKRNILSTNLIGGEYINLDIDDEGQITINSTSGSSYAVACTIPTTELPEQEGINQKGYSNLSGFQTFGGIILNENTDSTDINGNTIYKYIIGGVTEPKTVAITLNGYLYNEHVNFNGKVEMYVNNENTDKSSPYYSSTPHFPITLINAGQVMPIAIKQIMALNSGDYIIISLCSNSKKTTFEGIFDITALN